MNKLVPEQCQNNNVCRNSLEFLTIILDGGNEGQLLCTVFQCSDKSEDFSFWVKVAKHLVVVICHLAKKQEKCFVMWT